MVTMCLPGLFSLLIALSNILGCVIDLLHQHAVYQPLLKRAVWCAVPYDLINTILFSLVQ